MAVALRPRDFVFGAAFTPESPAPHDVWELYGEAYRVNPRHLIGDNDHEMVALWRLFQAGHLPDAGGTLDQAAAMIDAFALMSAAERDLAKELEVSREEGGRRDGA